MSISNALLDFTERFFRKQVSKSFIKLSDARVIPSLIKCSTRTFFRSSRFLKNLYQWSIDWYYIPRSIVCRWYITNFHYSWCYDNSIQINQRFAENRWMGTSVEKVNLNKQQLFTMYLRLILVFMRNSALRGTFNVCF